MKIIWKRFVIKYHYKSGLLSWMLFFIPPNFTWKFSMGKYENYVSLVNLLAPQHYFSRQKKLNISMENGNGYFHHASRHSSTLRNPIRIFFLLFVSTSIYEIFFLCFESPPVFATLAARFSQEKWIFTQDKGLTELSLMRKETCYLCLKFSSQFCIGRKSYFHGDV